MSLLERLDITTPIVQAPMAGVATPQLAAAVSNAGGLGSIGVGATDAAGAQAMIDGVRALTSRAFNVNVFTHVTPAPDPAREAAWLEALEPVFRQFGAATPTTLGTIYKSFVDDQAMAAMLTAAAVPVVSFHFGLPSAELIASLKGAGCILFATATHLHEALAANAAGIDAVVAQGWEAGGHRGVFDPDAMDDRLGTMALRACWSSAQVCRSSPPGVSWTGAVFARRSTSAPWRRNLERRSVACPESSADPAYRAALHGEGAQHTVMTAAISGRPARCLGNRFTAWASSAVPTPPAYPIAYDAGKAVNAAARSAGEFGFGAQWAGQGAPLSRAMPAAELVALLSQEAR